MRYCSLTEFIKSCRKQVKFLRSISSTVIQFRELVGVPEISVHWQSERLEESSCWSRCMLMMRVLVRWTRRRLTGALGTDGCS